MENWCEKHQAQWFKKGRMKGYAHPIGDTGQWCNMSEEEAAHPSTYDNVPLVKEAVNLGAEVESVSPKPSGSSEMSKEDWAEKEAIKRRSIERQSALYAAKDIAVAKISKGVEMTVEKTIAVAKEFAKYLDTGA